MHTWAKFFILITCLSLTGELLSAPKSISTEEFQQMHNLPATFTPPANWSLVDPQQLRQQFKNVKMMVIGKGSHYYSPSINLGIFPFQGTLKQFLKDIKANNEADGCLWQDLGTIQTKAGPASLSQVEEKTEWGKVQQMHVTLIKDGTVYLLTAAALKEEFPKFHQTFFDSLRSLQINEKN